MFPLVVVLGSLILLWLASGFGAIAIGLMILAIVAIGFMVICADCQIVVKVIGCIVGLGGTLFSLYITKVSSDGQSPGAGVVAGFFFGLLPTLFCIAVGSGLILHFSKTTDDRS